VSALYEAGTIKRERASRDEMAARQDALFEIVRVNQPTGIRFTYYTATTRGIVPKTDLGYRKVQHAVLDMRRAGRIPYSWITDSSRWMRKPASYNSLAEALESTARFYRRSLWSDANAVVEVWCESDSVAGVLYPVTAKWDVPLFPMKGQASDSFVWGAAQNYRDDPRHLQIYYVGDHDPAGYEIETNLHAKLCLFSGREDISFERLAVTSADVQNLNLSGTRPKKNNYRNALTGETVRWSGPSVEVEAIEPPLLRAWLDDLIAEHISPDELHVHKVAEASEREALYVLAGRAL
jgi:hypothetical protein